MEAPENLELQKKKDEASRTEKCDMMNNFGKKKLDHLDERIIRITFMRILHQFKLMTSNRFGILLILVERIKRDIA